MPLSSGDKLGPYEIVSPLGAGGMGEVYRARDPRLGRDVAVKILPAEVANDAMRRQRFEIEARAVAALNHPNIVGIYDVGDGYIVSELVDGEPLRAGKLSVRKTIDVAAQIASGLAAAHDAGIVHRDLKPDNILLTRDGRPKILDFGLAKVNVSPSATDATVTVRSEAGVVMGTVGYMSPEQVRGLVTDHRSDIFSFGVILHELLSGRRAFHGETSVDTMQAILRQDAPELPETVPAGLRQIVAHCLEKDVGDRFQSARDLRFALSSIAQSGSHSAIAPVRSTGRRWLLAAVAALALVVGLAAGKLLLRDAPAPQWSGVLLGGPEMAIAPRLSPDGHLLALQAFEQVQSQVAVMKPESGNWSILTHRRDRGPISQLSWSPDGSQIYHDRLTDVPLGIFSVPVLGGEEHLILENAGFPEALPDGSLMINRVNASRQLQLYHFWPETGRLQELPLESPGVTFIGAASTRMAPPGKEVITFASPIGQEGRGLGLYAVDLASGAIRRLALSEREAGTLQGWAVARDGKSVLAALPAGSATRVVAIPIKGQDAARTLFTVTSFVWFLDAAEDGSVIVNLTDRPDELVRLSQDGRGTPERVAAFPLSANMSQVVLLPDGRAVVAVSASGQLRLMAVSKGKDALPLLTTTEENAAPMTLAGPREIAFVIGPAPHRTIALAEIASGRVTRRIAPGKGAITGITASADGSTLYFCASGSVWTVASAGGEARAVTTGEYVVMEPSGRSLIVARGESSRIRMFHVPLDGTAEREIPADSANPLFTDHGGYFSSGSIDGKGRLLVSIMLRESWFNPIGILDTVTGRVTRVPGDPLSDHQSSVWTPDGQIVNTQLGLRATTWRFKAEGK